MSIREPDKELFTYTTDFSSIHTTNLTSNKNTNKKTIFKQYYPLVFTKLLNGNCGSRIYEEY
jgi:hypothetical protein